MIIIIWHRSTKPQEACCGLDINIQYCTGRTHYSDNPYRKIYNIRRTKPQNLNDSRLIVQLSLPNPLKPVI